MKNVTIRRGFFETASSSVHTFTIGGGRWDDSKIKAELSKICEKEGEIYFDGGQFGWGLEKYTDLKTRINYASLLEYITNYNTDMVSGLLSKHGFKSFVTFELEWRSENYSYIDHQSLEDMYDSIFSDLSAFLFSDDVVLIIDNDND
jgi:hypothetical protein